METSGSPSIFYFLNFFFGWKAGSLLQGSWLEGLLQAVDKDAGARMQCVGAMGPRLVGL